MTKKLILFDIDGTLISSGGAGARAMTRAFEAHWGISDALRKVDVAGRTDLIILTEALGHAGREFDRAVVAQFRDVYCGFLREELEDGQGRPKGELPGVRSLLDALAARPDVSLALLTGNFRESAEIKLRYFDLWHYFAWGVWGDEALDRHDLLPVALRRHLDRSSEPVRPEQVLIVGDTPHDVSCAHRGGAKVVAVATGNYDAGVLRGCGPDVCCEHLEDPAPFLALLDRMN